jgi:hypothetical protein
LGQKNGISALEVEKNHVQAKEFINPGGPPVFKLLFLGGSAG